MISMLLKNGFYSESALPFMFFTEW